MLRARLLGALEIELNGTAIFGWRLEPIGEGTRITVDVEIPDPETQRLDSQRQIISTSMTQLAQLASGETSPANGAPAA